MADQGQLGGDGGLLHELVVWGREIPHRNPHFTGREEEIQELRRRLVSESTAIVGQPPQPLYGLGGVGKTELAVEYAHRFRDEYSLVWWVRAEQADSVITALLALGRRLGIPDVGMEERENSTARVLDALNRGEPHQNYLLIFDDASDASIVRYLPRGPGHVIVTSRHTQWRKGLRVDGIEISEFKLSETVDYLRGRVPSLGAVGLEEIDGTVDSVELAMMEEEESRRHDQAVELAVELANLPLAAEHAAAYLVETGLPVSEYLALFRANAHQLLAQDVDIVYPRPVATTWSVSRGTISDEADALFKLLAFFASEPIPEELLVRPGVSLPGLTTLERVIADKGAFRAAVRQLARFSLINIDSVQNVVQVHRVVQGVTRGRLGREDPETERSFREAVHMLLAASDPGAPDRDDSDQAYERSIQHIIPSGALDSGDIRLRQLIINQVRRLCSRGAHTAALNLGRPALDRWRELHGRDDRLTLTLAVETGAAMRFADRWEEARQLNEDSIKRLRDRFGERDEAYLLCARSYGVDLTYQGKYREAYDNDIVLLRLYESVFNPTHPDTLQLRNNIAVSLRCLGRYTEALELDEATLAERVRVLGERDTHALTSKFAIARDYRMLGRFEDALDLLREVNEAFRSKGEPWNRHRLVAAAELGAALRGVGLYQDAAVLGHDVHTRFISVLGPQHRITLRNAICIVADERLANNLANARRLADEAVASWEIVAGPDHPNTVIARSNLAAVLRSMQNPVGAQAIDEEALEYFRRVYGDGHPNTVAVMANLAGDLAAMGRVGRARQLGESALEACRLARGPQHPSTLAIANNLSIDRRAFGDEAGALELREWVTGVYMEILGPEHPETRLCAEHGRIALDIEPMMS